MRPAGHAAVALVAAAMLHAGAAGAAPPPVGADPADLLVEASAALGAGEHERAATLAGQVARDSRPIDRKDRAEAWRVLGLAQYALGRKADAEAAFYAYLKLDPDGRLDPALVPPDVLHFFESVERKHKTELDALRPKPRRRRSMWLNFVPLGGQWQNGDRAKMWILGSAGAALLATNITSYVLLRRWCGPPSASATCDDGRTDDARRLQVLNIGAGVGLVALYAYSVIDGIQGYRRQRAEEAPPVQPRPMALGIAGDRDSVLLTVGGRF
jgi:hypothetical protein